MSSYRVWGWEHGDLAGERESRLVEEFFSDKDNIQHFIDTDDDSNLVRYEQPTHPHAWTKEGDMWFNWDAIVERMTSKQYDSEGDSSPDVTFE